MDDNTITLKMTLKVDGKWWAQMSEEDLIEYLTAKLNSNLGFRGQVKKLRLATRRITEQGTAGAA